MTIEKYEKQHTIIDETRRSIIDALLAIGMLIGTKKPKKPCSKT